MHRCSCIAESSWQLTSVPLLKKPECPVLPVRANNRHADRWQKGCVQVEGGINRPRSIVAASCAVVNDCPQKFCCSNRLLSGEFCGAATLCCVFIRGGAVCDLIFAGSVQHTLRCPARNLLLKTRRLGSFTFAMRYTPALKNCLLLWSELPTDRCMSCYAYTSIAGLSSLGKSPQSTNR